MARIKHPKSSAAPAAATTEMQPLEEPRRMTAEHERVIEEEDALREAFAADDGDPRIASPYAGLYAVHAAAAAEPHRWERVALSEEEEAQPKVLTKHRWHLPDDGPPLSAVASEEQWRMNWAELTMGVFDGMNWDGVFAAGGACQSSLMPDSRSGNAASGVTDIDLFLYGQRSDEEANQKLRHIHSVVTRNMRTRGQVIRTARAVTIIGDHPYRHVQIILRRYHSPSEVLHGFDVDSCAVGFNGKEVYMMERTRRAFTRGYNLVNMNRRSNTYETRLRKYARRGFFVIVPGLNKARVSPDLVTKSATEVRGLARLLLFEYYQLHPATARMWRGRYANSPVTGSYAARQIFAGFGEEGEAGNEALEGHHYLHHVSDYSDLYIPWGPRWFSDNIMASLRTADRAQFFSSRTAGDTGHKHLFVTGIEGVVNGVDHSAVWCMLCRDQQQLEGERTKYVNGPLQWESTNCVLQDLDNGRTRRLMSGSFQLSFGIWDEGVYEDAPPLKDGDVHFLQVPRFPSGYQGTHPRQQPFASNFMPAPQPALASSRVARPAVPSQPGPSSTAVSRGLGTGGAVRTNLVLPTQSTSSSPFGSFAASVSASNAPLAPPPSSLTVDALATNFGSGLRFDTPHTIPSSGSPAMSNVSPFANAIDEDEDGPPQATITAGGATSDEDEPIDVTQMRSQRLGGATVAIFGLCPHRSRLIRQITNHGGVYSHQLTSRVRFVVAQTGTDMRLARITTQIVLDFDRFDRICLGNETLPGTASTSSSSSAAAAAVPSMPQPSRPATSTAALPSSLVPQPAAPSPAARSKAKAPKAAPKAPVSTLVDDSWKKAKTNAKTDEGLKAWRWGLSSAPQFPEQYTIIKEDILQVTRLDSNNNKFYAMELHVAQEGGDNFFRVFSHYGRTDDLMRQSEAGQRVCRHYSTYDRALNNYNQLLQQKMKTNKGYQRVDVSAAAANIGSPVARAQRSQAQDESSSSDESDGDEPMDAETEELVELLYNESVRYLTTALPVQIGRFGVQTPLGALTTAQVQRGMDVLEEIGACVMSGATGDLSRLAGEFYTAIPHHLGRSQLGAASFRTEEDVRSKRELLSLMMDMVDAAGVLFSTNIRRKYRALAARIRSLPSTDPEYLMIARMASQLDLKRVFAIGKDSPFDDSVGNVQLLFHGSRIQNYTGLLKRSLLLPARATKSMGNKKTVPAGWLGDGIYFGSEADTSGIYTTPSADGRRYMLVCEVALGAVQTTTKITTEWKEAPPGYDSTHGVAGAGSDFEQNEWVVYGENRARIKYLLEFSDAPTPPSQPYIANVPLLPGRTRKPPILADGTPVGPQSGGAYGSLGTSAQAIPVTGGRRPQKQPATVWGAPAGARHSPVLTPVKEPAPSQSVVSLPGPSRPAAATTSSAFPASDAGASIDAVASLLAINASLETAHLAQSQHLVAGLLEVLGNYFETREPDVLDSGVQGLLDSMATLGIDPPTSTALATVGSAAPPAVTPVVRMPTSQQGWNELPGGLLVYSTSDFHVAANGKIAAFDMDTTIIQTRSGARFARNADDWMWMYESVPQKLAALASDGFAIVIITNQAGVGTSGQRRADIQRKIEAIIGATGIQAMAYVATLKNQWRKPSPRIWMELKEHLAVPLDIAGSFYCGDAAGRPRDHSRADIHFAYNCGVKFRLPEDVFLGKHCMLPHLSPMHLSSMAELPPFVGPSADHGLELVLLVGRPGAGKSTIAKCVFGAAGYVVINQDTLGSRERCLRETDKALASHCSVVVDNTNAKRATRAEFLRLAVAHKATPRAVVLLTTKAQAQHLNALRAWLTDADMVPNVAYTIFDKSYEAPTRSEGFARVDDVNGIDPGPSSPVSENVWMLTAEK